MKNQKGITLMALVVYIVVMLIAISLVSIITTSMTTNLENVEKTSKDVSKVNEFDMYFLSDIKNNGFSVYDTQYNEINKYIILETKDGNTIQYIFKDNVIYRVYRKDANNETQIQICNDIIDFQVSKLEDDDENVINIIIKTPSYESNKSYKIGKW